MSLCCCLWVHACFRFRSLFHPPACARNSSHAGTQRQWSAPGLSLEGRVAGPAGLQPAWAEQTRDPSACAAQPGPGCDPRPRRGRQVLAPRGPSDPATLPTLRSGPSTHSSAGCLGTRKCAKLDSCRRNSLPSAAAARSAGPPGPSGPRVFNLGRANPGPLSWRSPPRIVYLSTQAAWPFRRLGPSDSDRGNLPGPR